MLHSFPVPTQKNHSQPLPLSTSCPENPLCYGGKMPIDTTIKFTVKGPFLVLHILRVRTNLLTCINHYNVMQNNVLALKILCALPFHLYFLILSFLHLLTCVYIVWDTYPPTLLPSKTCSALLLSDFVEKKT
jgi:hypothetical protein